MRSASIYAAKHGSRFVFEGECYILVYLSETIEPAKWCSNCTDLPSLLILCAGCRVGLCMTLEGSKLGCLRWDKAVRKDDFVFYCPYCCSSMKKAFQVCVI